jgi:hypothetical protein
MNENFEKLGALKVSLPSEAPVPQTKDKTTKFLCMEASPYPSFGSVELSSQLETGQLGIIRKVSIVLGYSIN